MASLLQYLPIGFRLMATWHLVVLLIICNFFAGAQNYDGKFYHLGSEQGFPSEDVFTFHQDSNGFMWFGTAEGIVRYDGHSYRWFTPTRNDLSNVSSNLVHHIYEDRQKRLWVFGGNKVYVFNPVNETFLDTGLNLNLYGVNSNHRKAQNSIMEDAQGVIWIRSMGTGLYKITENQPGNFEISNYKISSEYPEQTAGDTITLLNLDRKGRLWVGTLNGLYTFDRNQSTYNKFDSISDHVTGFLVHKDQYWINYARYGLYTIDLETGLLEQKWAEKNETQWWSNWRYPMADSLGNLWMIKQHNDASPYNSLDRFEIGSGINQRYFTDDDFVLFGIDWEGIMWAGILDGRVYRFDATDNSFKLFTTLKVPPSNHLFFDSAKIVWINTEQGVQRYHFSNEKFSKLLSARFHASKVYNFDGIFEDSENQVLVLSDSCQKLIRYKVDEGRIKDSTNLFEEPIFRGRSLYTLRQDDQGHPWAVLRHHETVELVNLYNLPYRLNHRFKISSPSLNMIFSNTTATSIAVSDKGILIGGLGFGTVYIDKETNGVRHLQHNPHDHSTISDDLFNRVIKSKNGNLWIFNATGADLLDESTYKVQRAYSRINEAFFMIRDLVPVQGDRFWVASLRGLFLFDPQQGIIEQYPLSMGYPVQRIQKLQMDRHENLWLATSSGLVYFDTEKKNFRRYDKTDGLFDDRLNALCLRENGELLIGSNGMFMVNPEKMALNRKKPIPKVTELKIFNEAVAVGSDHLPLGIAYIDELVLPFNQSQISLSYSAMSFANPSKNQYAYYMEGLDHDWQFVGNQTSVTYQGLAPGSYVFNIKATNNDGLWNQESTMMKIIILPPWWKTWWAYALYATIFFLGIYRLYGFQVNRKLEQAETKRIFELDQFKSRFYTNLTHEFRTPLTVILGMSDQIDAKYQKIKQLIKRNTLTVLQLVNQLLDLSKLESGTLRLTLQQGDIVKFIRYVAESFHSLAESRGIDVHFRTEVPHLSMDFDPDKVMNIISNLLSNAIKFTPEGGHVSIIICKLMMDDGEVMQLKVTDTGCGIAADQLDRIFDRFYQIDSSPTRSGSGTGIGLALSKELIKLMNGDINISSTLGQGTELTIVLPITQQAELSDFQIALPMEQVVHFKLINTHRNKRLNRPMALIVEDSMDVVYYLKTCLQTEYALKVANNGQEGIEKAYKLVPDIIISDVMMPEKNGFQLCHTLKNEVKTSHIPIILLTAKATDEEKVEGLEKGADAYLIKPFNEHELKIRIQNLIEERRKMWRLFNDSFGYHPQKLKISSPDQQFLAQALRVLDKHKSDTDFDPLALQQELAVSRTLLHLKLKALTGQSTSKFIRTYRLKYAASLLNKDFGNIAEIAYQAGFNDQSYFTKLFRKQFGVAPSEYRKSRTKTSDPI